jgi:hypothetical protein
MLTSFASRLLIALAATAICACNFLMSGRKADETHRALGAIRDHEWDGTGQFQKTGPAE